MLDWFFIPVAILYFLVSGALFLFGINYYYLSIRAWLAGRSPQPEPEMKEPWPRVTVQLPIYNELYVAERLIQVVAQLDYPASLLQIQVLDDSTDETVAVVTRAVAQARANGVNILHLHRAERTGYKAGALQAAMATATGEFIAILDADFLPQPDFLRRALPYLQEPNVAFVQTRWGHLNRNYSWQTYLQSLAIDAHFMVEQFTRSQAGYLFNFNGTAGIWRKVAIEEAGGWTADTLTEDLDLSYRASLLGWKGRYARQIVVPAELPVDFNGFRRQQHRWARGSLETALKLGGRVWRGPLSLTQKYQATLHLLGYSVHILLSVLTLIYPLVVFYAIRYPGLNELYGIAHVFSLTSLAPTLFFIIGQQQQGRPWLRQLPRLLAVSVLGSGLMLNTVRAALEIVSKPKQAFERTAKFGVEQQNHNWMQQRYQLRFDSIVYFELALGFFNLGSAWWAWQMESWGIAMFASLFGSGLLLVAGTTIFQAVAVYRNRKARQRRTAIERAQLTQELRS
jgi:cellulose synthase/poly-beta-1,6-N-acetylglucosamine synthase-like glycosyltransferase